MSFIIGKNCVGCLDMACINVCPVDCINGPIYIDKRGQEIYSMSDEEKATKQVYIDPSMCIDCGACVPECPVDAIYRDEAEAIAMNDEESIHKNYEFYGLKFN